MRVQRLSMDNSWHLTVGGLRLLVDPWLVGPEVDYAGWFNTQWHATPAVPPDQVPDWDAVLITQKYPDHLHPQTLTALAPGRVLAPEWMATRVQSCCPRATVVPIPAAGWVEEAGVRVHWLSTRRRMDPIYEGVILDDGLRSVCFVPHGLDLDADHLAILRDCSPVVGLFSTHDLYQLPSWLGGQVAPGLGGLEALVQAVQPQWVVRTHDEPKRATGLVPRMARIRRFDPAEVPGLDWLAERWLDVPDYTPVDL